MLAKVCSFGIAVLLLAAVCSCGGGGGSSGGDTEDFAGAAQVTINVSPGLIDSGGRFLVRTEIYQVTENGILLKFRYPKAVSYVRGTAVLEAEGQEIGIEPDASAESGALKYLVFFMPRDAFGRRDFARVSFYLRGDAEVTDGRVEVDADIDDPNISNSREWSSSKPAFTAEDSDRIEVRG